MKKIQNSYKKSGVNISVANKFVNHIAKITNKNVKKTNSANKKEVIGGFGSLFDISNLKVKDPVIVSCTDGVGTKIEIANQLVSRNYLVYLLTTDEKRAEAFIGNNNLNMIKFSIKPYKYNS